jgi:predicted MFS family arabinose efflux permease
MASVGAVGAFAVSAASYVPFIWVALWILPRSRPGPHSASGFARGNLLAGVREIARTPFLRGALLTVLVNSLLCAPLLTFCPVLVRDAFGGDVGHFSLSIGAFGSGGLLGALGLLAVDPKRDRRPLGSWFAVGYGAVVALAALDPWPALLPVLFVLAGVSMTASNASTNAILQAAAPTSIRGQAVSLFMLAMRGGVSLGSLLTGLSVGWLGVREALLVNGILAIAAQLVVGRPWLRLAPPGPMKRAG